MCWSSAICETEISRSLFPSQRCHRPSVQATPSGGRWRLSVSAPQVSLNCRKPKKAGPQTDEVRPAQKCLRVTDVRRVNFDAVPMVYSNLKRADGPRVRPEYW